MGSFREKEKEGGGGGVDVGQKQDLTTHLQLSEW